MCVFEHETPEREEESGSEERADGGKTQGQELIQRDTGVCQQLEGNVCHCVKSNQSQSFHKY